ncbi:RNA lariat debranching enzyme [Rhodotorula toruloides]|uniref:RNA lariat debranching enzyme n=1 Tax=Rhodotorula toruloides TaxID=5286 RepID=A0A511KG86_RHOTO|nr:RNA lariat debranching enzyme [Rhodotorula toruloides]
MSAPPPPTSPKRSLRVAVIGCSHGTLDDIYASVERCDKEARKKGEKQVDLVICCGDFQAMRNTADLQTMACPVKYRALGHFHQYYSGQKKAPKLTIVIGGNHEASGYMWELYHGGWLAPDIYFLGFAGSVLVDGWLRIAGASGIWKSGDWKKGHFETVPFDDRTIRSIYHIREYDLKNRSMDVFLSHDWPLGIEQHGDINSNSLGSPPLHALLTSLQPRYWFSAHLHVKFAALFHHDDRKTVVQKREKRGWGGQPATAAKGTGQDGAQAENPDEIKMVDEDEEGANGGAIVSDEGPISEEKGCPSGCAAHDEPTSTTANPDEITLDGEEELAAAAAANGVAGVAQPELAQQAASAARTTKFLALNKPGKNRDFLQVLDIVEKSSSATVTPDSSASPANPDDATVPSPTRPKLFFDPAWLAIVRSTAPYLSLSLRPIPFPPLAELAQTIEADEKWVKENVGNDGLVEVDEVMEFVRTAPTQEDWQKNGMIQMPSWYTNPQTLAFTALLQIENRINPIPTGYLAALEADKKRALEEAKAEALREIEMAGERIDEEPAEERANEGAAQEENGGGAANPEEIAIDDED